MLRTNRRSFKATKRNEDYDFDNEKLKEMIGEYNDANSPSEKKQEIALFFLEAVKGLIVEQCNKFANDRVSFDDMFQQCQLAVLEALPKFNPEKGRISTYFGNFIVHETQILFNPESMTNHYGHVERALKKASADYEIPYTKENVKTLAKLAEISYQSALQAYELGNITKEQFNPEVAARSEIFGQPENIVEEEEKKQKIRESINKLSFVERYVIEQTFFEDSSIEDITRKLSEYDSTLNRKKVMQIKKNAFNKLEPLLRKQGYGGRSGYLTPIYTRSDDELEDEMQDIANAFDDDCGSSLLIKLNISETA